MKKRTLRGFTLIETILVLAIAAALAAVLFGALGSAREAGRRSGCMSNLHQWGHAFSMYIADWDGQEPVKGQEMSHAQMGLPDGGPQFNSLATTYHLINTPAAYCPSTHYSPSDPIKVHRMTSYHVPAGLTEKSDPDLGYTVAQFGPTYPLMVCDMHNADTDWPHQPTWARKNVQVLLINQQVVYKNVPASAGDFAR